MDLAALTWQASTGFDLLSRLTEKRGFASFCARPTFPALDADVTVVGCVPLDPPRFVPWLGRLTGDRAVPAISAPARACNDVQVGMRGRG